jgi:hypothetical protein
VELLEIEMKARLKGATSEQISSIRRVNDASARDRLRQEKATSSQTGSPFTTPGTMTPSYHSQQTQHLYQGSILSRTQALQSSPALSTQQSQGSAHTHPAGSSPTPSLPAFASTSGISDEDDELNIPANADREPEPATKAEH